MRSGKGKLTVSMVVTESPTMKEARAVLSKAFCAQGVKSQKKSGHGEERKGRTYLIDGGHRVANVEGGERVASPKSSLCVPKLLS